MNNYLPAARTARGFVPPPPGVGVAGPSPNDPGVVASSKYTIDWLDTIWLNFNLPVTPKRDGKRASPGASQRSRRNSPIGHAPASWQWLFVKTEHFELNSQPFNVVSSGIDCD